MSGRLLWCARRDSSTRPSGSRAGGTGRRGGPQIGEMDSSRALSGPKRILVGNLYLVEVSGPASSRGRTVCPACGGPNPLPAQPESCRRRQSGSNIGSDGLGRTQLEWWFPARRNSHRRPAARTGIAMRICAAVTLMAAVACFHAHAGGCEVLPATKPEDINAPASTGLALSRAKHSAGRGGATPMPSAYVHFQNAAAGQFSGLATRRQDGPLGDPGWRGGILGE